MTSTCVVTCLLGTEVRVVKARLDVVNEQQRFGKFIKKLGCLGNGLDFL